MTYRDQAVAIRRKNDRSVLSTPLKAHGPPHRASGHQRIERAYVTRADGAMAVRAHKEDYCMLEGVRYGRTVAPAGQQ